MGQICDLQRVKLWEIPVKVCEMFHNIEICYSGCGDEKARFSAIV